MFLELIVERELMSRKETQLVQLLKNESAKEFIKDDCTYTELFALISQFCKLKEKVSAFPYGMYIVYILTGWILNMKLWKEKNIAV